MRSIVFTIQKLESMLKANLSIQIDIFFRRENHTFTRTMKKLEPQLQFLIPDGFEAQDITFSQTVDGKLMYVLSRKISPGVHDFIANDISGNFTLEIGEISSPKFSVEIFSTFIHISKIFHENGIRVQSAEETYSMIQLDPNMDRFKIYLQEKPKLISIFGYIQGYGMNLDTLLFTKKISYGLNIFQPTNKIAIDKTKVLSGLVNSINQGKNSDLVIPFMANVNLTNDASTLNEKIYPQLSKFATIKESIMGSYLSSVLCEVQNIEDILTEDKNILCSYEGSGILVIQNQMCLSAGDKPSFYNLNDDSWKNNWDLVQYDPVSLKQISTDNISTTEMQALFKSSAGQPLSLETKCGIIKVSHLQMPEQENPIAEESVPEPAPAAQSPVQEVVEEVIPAKSIPSPIIQPGRQLTVLPPPPPLVTQIRYQILHLQNPPQYIEPQKPQQSMLSPIQQSPDMLRSASPILPIHVPSVQCQVDYSETIRINDREIKRLEQVLAKATKSNFMLQNSSPIQLDDTFRQIFSESAKVAIPSLVQTKQDLLGYVMHVKH
ncbi:hypothetical protein SS50377_25140 [Spironucleus salmonicida]|uniref:Uncharacterized protein n=2 Tax=Spironucleus salmonicida TaxID=348837 RepID=A0A9P8LRP7_9EUKA|nr:hypothetical protein SS50377_25140 [Spironucleus salmonicida]